MRTSHLCDSQLNSSHLDNLDCDLQLYIGHAMLIKNSKMVVERAKYKINRNDSKCVRFRGRTNRWRYLQY